MNNAIKKSFNIVFKNSSLMLPLILYLLFIMIFSAFMGMKILLQPVLIFPFLILVYFILSIFLSGWLGIIKYAVDNYPSINKDDPNYPIIISKYNLDTIRNFFSCVGEYFLSIFIICLIFTLLITALLHSGEKIFDVSILKFLKFFQSSNPIVIQNIANSNPEKFTKWALFVLYSGGLIHLFQFLFMFWLPTLFYKTKNPLKALFHSIGFLFKNLLYSIGLYLFIFICSCGINILGAIAELNTVTYLIFLFLALNYLIFIFTLIFESYRYKTVESIVAKVNSEDVFIKSSDIKGREDGKE